MRPALVLALLIYGLILAGLATVNGALLALALPLAVYLAAGLLDHPDAPNLRATRSLSAERAPADAPVAVRVSVTNLGARAAELLLEDRLPPALTVVEGAPSLLATLAPGATFELAYTVRGRRGLHRFSGLQASARDRWGLIGRQAFIETPGPLVVVP